MSDSDQTRREYRWDTMSIGERVESLKARIDCIEESPVVNGRFPRRPTVDGRCVISMAELEHLERVKGAAKSLMRAVDETQGGMEWIKSGTFINSLREALKL